MSEYQFYEFKAIDKPLSESDKKEIGSWSSRTNPTLRKNEVVIISTSKDFPCEKLL